MTVRIGLGRGPRDYAGLAPPWHPDTAYPEFAASMGAAPTSARNGVYAAVRAALAGLGLDAERHGSADWNPLGALVGPGARIVLKPNFIRHWNPLAEGDTRASVESVITHGSVLRAALDYAFLAAGETGEVIIAEAPQQDCDWEAIRALAGLDALQTHYRETQGRALRIIDLRREAVHFDGGVIVSRKPLPGDPQGYRAVDLGEASFFTDSGLDPQRFRGADYDPGPTTEHHTGGRNAYLLSETVLSCDLIVNLPKLKTHKKTGVTLALKNMVGINGDKNWLPHHSVGAGAEGGDEYPGRSLRDRARSQLAEVGRQLLKRGVGTGLARFYRRAEIATRGDDFIRAGNWHGNRTTWRMCADLNRCVYYSDASGPRLDANAPVQQVLTLLDGIVAGEGNGPLAPIDVPLGVIIAGTDPIGVDLVAVRLMDFDERRIAKIWEPMKTDTLRVTAVRTPDDVVVGDARVDSAGVVHVEVGPLSDVSSPHSFLPHPGWLNHIERRADGDRGATRSAGTG